MVCVCAQTDLPPICTTGTRGANTSSTHLKTASPKLSRRSKDGQCWDITEHEYKNRSNAVGRFLGWFSGVYREIDDPISEDEQKAEIAEVDAKLEALKDDLVKTKLLHRDLVYGENAFEGAGLVEMALLSAKSAAQERAHHRPAKWHGPGGGWRLPERYRQSKQRSWRPTLASLKSKFGSFHGASKKPVDVDASAPAAAPVDPGAGDLTTKATEVSELMAPKLQTLVAQVNSEVTTDRAQLMRKLLSLKRYGRWDVDLEHSAEVVRKKHGEDLEKTLAPTRMGGIMDLFHAAAWYSADALSEYGRRKEHIEAMRKAGVVIGGNLSWAPLPTEVHHSAGAAEDEL